MTPSADPALPVRTSLVTTIGGLEALAPAWDPLVRAMRRPSPFLLHGWVCEWWNHLGAPTGAELAVAVAHRGDRLVGAAPLIVRRRHGLRVAEFLGGHESALADLLIDPTEPATTGETLLKEAARGGRAALLDVFGLPGGSHLAGAAGQAITVVERVEAPVMLMPDGWAAAYAAKTGSKKRNHHRRRLRQLGEVGSVEFAVARTLGSLEPALEEAFRLHAMRWHGRPDRSQFTTPRGMAFHRAALRRIAAIDVPRIVLLRLDGRAIAHFYSFALEGRMVVHCLAFDPAFSGSSPGLLTTLHALEAAGDEGLRIVEFLGGDERYKLELADSFEPLHQAIGLTAGPLARIAVGSRLTTIAARRRLKTSPLARSLYYDRIAPARRLVRRIRP